MNSTHPRALAPVLLLLVAGVVGAADMELSLGRGEAWKNMTDRLSVGTETGRWGGLDLVLRDAAYEPTADTELLVHFDETPFADAAGRYTASAGSSELSRATRVMGSAAGAFLGPREALRLSPRPGSLLWPDTAWRDFTIEFWLYPATLGDGETLLSWSGQSVDGVSVSDQALSCIIRQRKLQFSFEGLFPGAPRVVLTGATPLVPRKWHHHLVRFDSRYGLIEYLVDGRPEAVTHATETGREGGTLSTPRIAPGTPQPLLVGKELTGLIDELRVSRRWIDEPALTRLDGRVGSAVSRVFDLRLAGTTVRSLDAVWDHPANTEVYFYYRMGDRLRGRGELDSSWIQVEPGATPTAARGRYLQLRVELLPDGGLWQGPSVSSITVRYEPDLPPAPPAGLIAQAEDGGVRLRWPRVNESDVAGYRVYWGERPGIYQAVLDAGEATEYVVDGLENGRLYYFTVITYDQADPTRRSAFAPEVGARPSALRL